jgi:hypothetical protein
MLSRDPFLYVSTLSWGERLKQPFLFFSICRCPFFRPFHDIPDMGVYTQLSRGEMLIPQQGRNTPKGERIEERFAPIDLSRSNRSLRALRGSEEESLRSGVTLRSTLADCDYQEQQRGEEILKRRGDGKEGVKLCFMGTSKGLRERELVGLGFSLLLRGFGLRSSIVST